MSGFRTLARCPAAVSRALPSQGLTVVVVAELRGDQIGSHPRDAVGVGMTETPAGFPPGSLASPSRGCIGGAQDNI